MLAARILNLGRQLLQTNFTTSIAPLQSIRHKYKEPMKRIGSSSFYPKHKQTIKFPSEQVVDENICKEEIAKVNDKIANEAEGRLFAIVQLCGKQFKVTAGDIIVLEGYWAPTIGDKLRLEKVILVGGDDFSMVGRPLVQTGLVDVQATVIEKTLAHTRTVFKKKRRKQYTNIKFHRSPQSMVRINSITLTGNVNENVKPLPGQNIYQ